MRTQDERRKIDGIWVKTLRKELGLNQAEFAARLDVSRSAIARWELNVARPTKLAANALLLLAGSSHGGKEPEKP